MLCKEYNLISLHLRSADILVTRAGPRDNLRDNKHMCDDGDVAEEHIYEEIVQDDPSSPANDEDKVSS